MPTTHIVQQGEYITFIAEQYGFHTHTKIWDDPANAKLKALRKNPNVLLPDDELVIPDKEKKQEPRPVDKRHKFVKPGETLRLRLVIKNESAEAVANTDCRLDLDGKSQDLTTDGDGKLKQVIPHTTRQGRLVIKNEDLAIDLVRAVGVGELDPVDHVTGQIGRLNNLGYNAGNVQEPADDEAKEQFRSALEEFQCNEKLTVDNICGPMTQDKLKEVHGC